MRSISKGGGGGLWCGRLEASYLHLSKIFGGCKGGFKFFDLDCLDCLDCLDAWLGGGGGSYMGGKLRGGFLGHLVIGL